MGVRDRLKARVAATKPAPASPPIPWLTEAVEVAPPPKREPRPKLVAVPRSPREHTCETCPTPLTGPRRFCPGCSQARQRMAARAKRPPRDPVRKCRWVGCGAEFIPHHPNNLYCCGQCAHASEVSRRLLKVDA